MNGPCFSSIPFFFIISLLDVKNRLSLSSLHQLSTYLKLVILSSFRFLFFRLPSPFTIYVNISSCLMLFRPLIQPPDSPAGPRISCSMVLRSMVLKFSCSGPAKPLPAKQKVFVRDFSALPFFFFADM